MDLRDKKVTKTTRKLGPHCYSKVVRKQIKQKSEKSVQHRWNWADIKY